ncbi:MAG: M24 family metallopeptidase [Planctomycetota bacterium]
MALAVYRPEDIERIAAVARRIDGVLAQVTAAAVPGVTPLQLDAHAREQLAIAGLESAHEMPVLESGRRASLLVNINSTAAHGLPTGEPLGSGDVVTLDCAARDASGWHADLARAVVVGRANAASRGLVLGAGRVTAAAIGAMRAGGRWAEVVRAARGAAHGLGLAIVPGLGGHGVGRRAHERPAAIYEPFDPARDDFELRPGLVLTVEPVVAGGFEPAGPGGVGEGMGEGGCRRVLLTTVDASPGGRVRLRGAGLCACREETVAMTEAGAAVLSGSSMTRCGEGRKTDRPGA